ncbi:hypothetical protein DKX38_009946 [Salix brachista]|uniref:Uncharacterized protein n=1 Tax=Salix brachista TaxID=2182728 RepID=A0A5N5MBZ2_9ROSI|nr:hypothetical protein DKX38_009946 [Salix brachista]
MVSIKGSGNYTMILFVKFGEAFKKTRDEKPHNFPSSEKFYLAEELYFSPINCIHCFSLVIRAMVDDMHEKMGEHSRLENAEREMRSMQGTDSLRLATDVYLSRKQTALGSALI